MLKKVTIITLILIALAGVGTLAYQQLAPTKEAGAPEAEQETGQEKPGMIKTELEAPQEPLQPPEGLNQTSSLPQELTPTDEIDTSDWRTYRNEEFGFEISYPARLRLNTRYDLRPRHDFLLVLEGVMGVDVHKVEPSIKTIEEYNKKYVSGGSDTPIRTINRQEVEFNGKPAIEKLSVNPNSGKVAKGLNFVDNGFVYFISGDVTTNMNRLLFDNILTTFTTFTPGK